MRKNPDYFNLTDSLPDFLNIRRGSSELMNRASIDITTETRKWLKRYKRYHKLKSMDAVITHMRQQLQDRANNDDSASDSSSSEELRKFSFDWFSKHSKARQYFLGLDDDAFEWLDANFTPEVLSKCSVTVFCVTFILSLLYGVLCDLAMHSSQLLYVCPSHICS